RRRMRGKDVEKTRKEVRGIAPGRGRYAVPLHCETFSLPVLDTSEGRGYFCSHSVTCMMTDSVHKERWAKRERQESSSARTHLQVGDRDIQGMGAGCRAGAHLRLLRDGRSRVPDLHPFHAAAPASGQRGRGGDL